MSVMKELVKEVATGEDLISIDYLQKVHEKYEKLYSVDNTNFSNKVIIITVDASQTPEQVYESVMNQLISKIRFSVDSI